MEISGKKVVVIGGASGMGRATAELLAERGAHVAVLDRENSDGKAVAEGLGGGFYPVDVTDFTGTEETLQTAVDNLGGLHVAVTTAGGGIAKRTLTKSGPTTSNPSSRSSISTSSPPSTSAAWPPRTWPRTSRKIPKRVSAASSSTPHPSRRSRARSGRSPTPPPRPRSPACA
ncbi:3-hydroxyacyl-CoA dehydrogenase type-2 [Mycobacterium kansasii]|uniref:3-hydroxyacyl-CoA dehydrogenase type-2 n=1 Tax=Mycobacterium kansasii TaxID=1768 RepID=A0A1V3Y053_MYCKA|nr:3-hydroxyacyl-CoA dehydrogenase type-2 [Mycobacterium kansasii]